MGESGKTSGAKYQLAFLRPSQMLMFATVSCTPALGQSTVIPTDNAGVKFTVLIESSISFSNQPWEAVIWHNGNEGQTWGGLELSEVKQVTDAEFPVSTRGRPSVYRRYFSGYIAKSSIGASARFQFTLKYRTTESAWKWVNDSYGLTDGDIIFQSTTGLSTDISHYLRAIDSNFEIQLSHSDVPDTMLWTISLPVEAAGEESAFNMKNLGVPCLLNRWFALVRLWAPWLGPRHGKFGFEISEDGLMASFLRNDGLNFVILAISGVGDTLTVLRDDGKGGVIVKARNEDIKAAKAKLVVAAGLSFGTALAACVYQARKLASDKWEVSGVLENELETSEDTIYSPESYSSDAEKMNPKTVWSKSWLDGLTYCTWNGLGQKLSEQKILDALDDLDAHNIKITTLIIDDNWQSLDNPGMFQTARGWTEFEANKEGFPKGLEHCVIEARDQHPSIDHVAVWHALFGYWGGISPTGRIAKHYKTQEVRKAHMGKAANAMTVVAAEDVERFYDDFYRFLQNCRIDSVKTDAQFFLDVLHDPADRRNLIRKYQDVWAASSLKWFSNLAISCMSLVPQIIFHSQLPVDRAPICIRNSDDFFPEVPSSHTWHIFTNAYTSLFTHHLNAVPDWDMFQTYHEYSSFHAAARCISGGPIYITDEPGNHDMELISQMTAQDNRGNTIVLRPSTVGRAASSGVYTAYEEERFLKVSTFHGSKGTGSSLLGVFNVSGRALTELLELKEFPGIEREQRYVLRAHTTGEISNPMYLEGNLALVSLFLEVKHWEILTAYPLRACGDMHVAPLGLLGKMTGAAAILATSIELDESNRVRVSAKLKALGTYGLYVSDLPQKSIERDFLALINDRPVPLGTVTTVSHILSIDIARAWEESGAVPRPDNEVSILVLIS